MFLNNNNNIQNNQQNNNNNNFRDSLILGIRKTNTYKIKGNAFRQSNNVSLRSSINSSKEISSNYNNLKPQNAGIFMNNNNGINDLNINRQFSSNGTNITNFLDRCENPKNKGFTECLVNEIFPKKDNQLLNDNHTNMEINKDERFTEVIASEILPKPDNSWLHNNPNYKENKNNEGFTNGKENEILPNDDNPFLITIFSDTTNMKKNEKENSIDIWGENKMMPKDDVFETNKSNIEKNNTTDVVVARILPNNDENNLTNSTLNNNSKNTTNVLINGISNEQKGNNTNISTYTNFVVDNIILNKNNANQLNQLNTETNKEALYYTEGNGCMYCAKF
jgi:uncharacterized protein (DUF4213/DUF364 family)